MLSICCVAIAGGLVARKAASAPAAKDSAAPRQEVRLERRTPEYWRVTFDNPPFNIFGPETIPQLNAVITQIEKDSRVRVVVFDSAVPGFFLTHYDFVPPLSATTSLPPGPDNLPPLPDMFVRLSRAPVVSIVSIRDRRRVGGVHNVGPTSGGAKAGDAADGARVAEKPGRREAARGLHRETRGGEMTCQARPLRRSAVTIARNPPAQ
jgi:hypothetical protein